MTKPESGNHPTILQKWCLHHVLATLAMEFGDEKGSGIFATKIISDIETIPDWLHPRFPFLVDASTQYETLVRAADESFGAPLTFTSIVFRRAAQPSSRNPHGFAQRSWRVEYRVNMGSAPTLLPPQLRVDTRGQHSHVPPLSVLAPDASGKFAGHILDMQTPPEIARVRKPKDFKPPELYAAEVGRLITHCELVVDAVRDAHWGLELSGG